MPDSGRLENNSLLGEFGTPFRISSELRKELLAGYGKLSTPHFILAVLCNWAIIVSCFFLIFIAFNRGGIEALVFCWFCCIVVGARQHALFFLTHETAHRLICRSRGVNDAIGSAFCAFPIFITLDAYRPFHFEHHRELGSDQDPELKFYESFGQWNIPTCWKDVARQTFVDLLGFNLRYPATIAFQSRPQKKATWIAYLVYWFSVLSVCFYLGQMWIPFVWIFSYVSGFWWVQRINTWTEHLGTTGTHRFSANWWQRFLFFPFNSWCHWEHHELPQIPFFNLPLIRQATSDKTIPSLNAVFPNILSGSADKEQSPRRFSDHV